MSCGIRLRTALSVERLETIADDVCRGDVSITIEDIDTERRRKTLVLVFEDEHDRDAFRAEHHRIAEGTV